MTDDIAAAAAASEASAADEAASIRIVKRPAEVEDVLFALRLYRELFAFREGCYGNPVTVGEQVAFHLLHRALQELPEEEIGDVNCEVEEMTFIGDIGNEY